MTMFCATGPRGLTNTPQNTCTINGSVPRTFHLCGTKMYIYMTHVTSFGRTTPNTGQQAQRAYEPYYYQHFSRSVDACVVFGVPGALNFASTQTGDSYVPCQLLSCILLTVFVYRCPIAAVPVTLIPLACLFSLACAFLPLFTGMVWGFE